VEPPDIRDIDEEEPSGWESPKLIIDLVSRKLANQETRIYERINRRRILTYVSGVCVCVYFFGKSLAFPVLPNTNNTFITSKFIVLYMSDINFINVA
jgi:hypothetical protein